LTDVTGLVNQAGGIGYPNFWTYLSARDNPAYVPVVPAYTFGGGGATLRVGQQQGTSSLSIFHATSTDMAVVGQIYDTIGRASPIQPASIIDWMANSAIQSVNGAGDTVYTIQLRQDLEFHNGVAVTPNDLVKSVLAFKNVVGLKGATVLDAVTAQITFNGADPYPAPGAYFPSLMKTPVIPIALWDTNGDGSIGMPADINNDGTVNIVDLVLVAGVFGTALGAPGWRQASDTNLDGKIDIVDLAMVGANFGKATDASLAPGFDPLVAGILIGSGPWTCLNLFLGLGPIGTVGLGCATTVGGAPSSQTIAPGGNLFLQKFDFAAAATPFYQYMRNYDPAWPGVGLTRSGMFQEFSWADFNRNAIIDINDATSASVCVGPAPKPGCPAATFAHWDMVPPGGGVTPFEAGIVQSHVDESYVAPFAWNTASLANIIPY